jgi:hypothetical protein
MRRAHWSPCRSYPPRPAIIATLRAQVEVTNSILGEVGSKIDPSVSSLPARAPRGHPDDGIPTLARVANGWSMNTDTTSICGKLLFEAGQCCPLSWLQKSANPMLRVRL